MKFSKVLAVGMNDPMQHSRLEESRLRGIKLLPSAI